MKYRLRIDENPWTDWTAEAEISIPGLSAGDHAVEIQAREPFSDPTSPVRVPFPVEPPLYRRPEVILPISMLAVTIALLSGAYWRRDRKHKRQLEQSDERFRLIASSTSDLIFDWNFTSNVLWSNDPSRVFTAAPSPMPEEVFNSWLDHVSENDRDRIRSNFLTALDRQKPEWHEEYRYLRKDQTHGHMLHRVQIFYDDSGKPVRMIGSGMDISERKEAEELSRDLSRRILEAQERERRRVSRELHDSVNQILASVKFRIESLEEQLTGRSPRFKREAKKTKQLLNKVMTEVRRISRNLRPAELDDLGLASAVRSLAEEFTERTGIEITLIEPWPSNDLSPEITETLYRIIQEALTNVEKHSKARRVSISFTTTPEQVACSISDNGRGIQPDERGKARSKGGGLGIVDMRERLSFLKGTLEISPRGKRGTTLTVRIPLKSQPTSQQTSQSKLP
jgi:signal transduction histidine kinase